MSLKIERRIFTVKEFFYFIEDVLRHIKEIRRAKRHQLVDRNFSHRIMLAVTKVNGCRFCSYYHTKNALKSGMPEEEIQNLLKGDLDNVPAEESVALIFAQHYAETKGKTDVGAFQRLLDVYGEQKMRDIMAFIRVIMMGNIHGAALDAFWNRLKGNAAEGSKIGQEFMISIGFIAFIPLILIRWIWHSLIFILFRIKRET